MCDCVRSVASVLGCPYRHCLCGFACWAIQNEDEIMCDCVRSVASVLGCLYRHCLRFCLLGYPK